MTWTQYHSQSEHYAQLAEAARRARDFDQAKQFYRRAAEQGEQAIAVVATSKARTLGITAVSAAALWYKAGEYAQARRLAEQCLTTAALPTFATAQLQALLAEIEHVERMMKDVEEWRASVPVSAVATQLLMKAVEEWKTSAVRDTAG